MRAREFITESSDVLNSIQNLLLSAKGAGFTKVPVKSVISKLRDAGYSIGNESLYSALRNNEDMFSSIVDFSNMDSDQIYLISQLDDVEPDPMQDSGEIVKGMAQNQLARKDASPVSDMAQNAAEIGN